MVIAAIEGADIAICDKQGVSIEEPKIMITAPGYKMFINITNVKMISEKKVKISKAFGCNPEKYPLNILTDA